MKIICNSEAKEVSPGQSLEDFILGLALNPDTVVIESNGQIVRRDEYADHLLEEGETLELIRFVGGG